MKPLRLAPWALLLALAGLGGQVAAQGFYFDALFYDSREKREQDVPKLAKAGFDLLASSFTAKEDAVLKLCQDNGVSEIIYQTNTGSLPEHRKQWDAWPKLHFQFNVADDADLTQTPDKLKTLVASIQPQLRPDMETYATFSKSAKPELWANITKNVHLQLYIYHEGGLKKWGWDYPKAWRAAHKNGKVYIGPYLGKNMPVFFGAYPKYSDGRPAPPEPWWTESVYTPLAWNEAQVWMGICLGCEPLYYSAYSISAAIPTANYRICDQPRLLAGYAELNAQIKAKERFTKAVKPVTFESADGRFVGATWTLQSGESLRCEIDTLDAKPDVVLRETPAAPPPPKPAEVTVRITSDGRSVKVETLP